VPAGSPPPVLQLAGHALRWQLLTELARSDLRVHELTARTGEPQNLVSYHLRKLRDAGLVSSRRSSADGRDAYYSADLPALRDGLAAAGGDVHPGLRLVPAPVVPSADGRPVARVLFLCTGNSARSRMAEALLEARSGGLVDAESAGSNPKPLHPNAVRVLREEHGVELSGRESTHLDAFASDRFDAVVSLCDRVREVCPELPAWPTCTHWSLPDPAAEGGSDDETYPAFRRTAAELDARIEFLLAALLDRSAPMSA
jgi:ArsR family transcriptional regulator, arsenate/arsenite/antimonite-responsive transcriptional repressor / arsenate reductase (thioredoxin)